jgi:hypothetical protein
MVEADGGNADAQESIVAALQRMAAVTSTAF